MIVHPRTAWVGLGPDTAKVARFEARKASVFADGRRPKQGEQKKKKPEAHANRATLESRVLVDGENLRSCEMAWQGLAREDATNGLVKRGPARLQR